MTLCIMVYPPASIQLGASTLSQEYLGKAAVKGYPRNALPRPTTTYKAVTEHPT
jgi:hypothetical protein